MTLNVAVQMDPIARINIRGDSTFALLLEAQKRGHSLSYYTPDKLSLRGEELLAPVQELTVRDEAGDHFTLGEPKRTPLASFDVVLLRQDPPFDLAMGGAEAPGEDAVALGHQKGCGEGFRRQAGAKRGDAVRRRRRIRIVNLGHDRLARRRSPDHRLELSLTFPWNFPWDFPLNLPWRARAPGHRPRGGAGRTRRRHGPPRP